MPKYKLQAPYVPKGDQPAAIKGLVEGVNDGLIAPLIKEPPEGGIEAIGELLLYHW